MLDQVREHDPGSQPDADVKPIAPTMFGEANSSEVLELMRVAGHVNELLDTLRVDVERHRFIGKNGVALGIMELVRRIHGAEPDMAVDDIEQNITDYLEQSHCPEGISQARMDKLQAQIEDWIEVHWRADEPKA